MLGGIEVHIAEHHPVDPGEQNGGWRAATLRINFVDQPATRMAFGAVRHIVTAARCSTDVFAGLDAAARPYRQLAEMAFFDSLDAVLFMGEDSGTPANALQEVVDALPETVRGLVTLVGDDCLRCHSVRGVNGFVQGASTTSPATMASAFSPMAALNAPHTLPCLDREDVGASPGTALQPAALAEAIWLRRECKLN